MKYKLKISSIAWNVLIFLSLTSLTGGIIYRAYALNNIGIAISLILAIISFIIIQRIKPQSKEHKTQNIDQKQPTQEYSILNIFIVISYLLLITAVFCILLSRQTADSIISPWQVVPNYFFIIYALSVFVLVIIINKNNKAIKQFNNLTIFLIIIHYFLSFSIALIIYKIGYGYDSFIHQATEKLIDKTGAVEPKQFYYLGQYALITILHKITFIPIVWIDKLLVPLLSAVYIPLAFWHTLKKIFTPLKINYSVKLEMKGTSADDKLKSLSNDNILMGFSDKKIILFIITALLALPFSFFIVTTPQNLGFLFLLLAIIYGLACKNIYDLILIYLFSLVASLTQPIAGIPAVMFALALTVYHSDFVKTRRGASIKKYFYTVIFIISSIALPLAFYILENGLKISPLKIGAGGLKNIITPFIKEGLGGFLVPNQENFILNFIYFYGFNLKFIIAILTVAGLIIAYRRREHCKIFTVYILMSTATFISFLLSKTLSFNFLIDYERNNYTDRIFIVASFFLLPFIIIALYALIEKVLKQPRAVKLPFTIFFILIITAGLYLSYPRIDNYFNSRGYSTGQIDIMAVRWIEENAKSDYIVLANQHVSAAALREFGFAKYYKSRKSFDNQHLTFDIFYYPIPTGESLYQYYLDMVYKKPNRETMSAAMNLVGVSEGYFVLNKYWWAFPKLLEEAKLEADSWKELGNGDVFVFKYTLQTN